jgi:tetratricopeptide (TPR) repeat protein
MTSFQNINLGKLSIAILENYVEKVIGKNGIAEIKESYISSDAIVKAIRKTEKRCLETPLDPELARAIFIDLPTIDLPAIKKVINEFQDNPTNPNCVDEFAKIIRRDFPSTDFGKILSIVENYIEILTEELCQVDSVFQQKVVSIAAIKTERNTARLAEMMLSSFSTNENSEQSQKINKLYNIPKPPINFVGRLKNLEKLKNDFDIGVSAFFINGKPGSGKTSLARKFAHEIKEEFQYGHIEIDLQGSNQDGNTQNQEALRRFLVCFYPSQALPESYPEILALYKETLGKYKILVLIDNVSDISQIRDLIPPSPSVGIITSRNTYSLSEAGMVIYKLGEFDEHEACEFLRTSTSRLSNASKDILQNLSISCGNLPLGLRIIAALLEIRQDWSPEKLLQKLEDKERKIDQLKIPDDKQLDLEAALQLSYEILNENQKSLFRKLGIFAARFTSFDGAGIWDVDVDAAELFLSDFVRYNLLDVEIFDSSPKSKTLYVLHSLISAYAYKLLTQENELNITFEKYANHYIDWGDYLHTEYLKGSAASISAIRFFDEIFPHIEYVWSTLKDDNIIFDGNKKEDLCNSFASSFPDILMLKFSASNLVEIFSLGVSAAKTLDKKTHLYVNQNNLGVAYRRSKKFIEALACFEESLKFYRREKNIIKEMETLGNIANTYVQMENSFEAKKLYDQIISFHKKEKNYFLLAADLLNLANALFGEKNYYEAAIQLEKALNIANVSKDIRTKAIAHANLGVVFLMKSTKRTSLDQQKKMLDSAYQHGYQAYIIANEIKDKEILALLESKFPWSYS